MAEGAHFALVVCLAVALAALLCYASTRRFVRMDWHTRAPQPLTAETDALLRSIDVDIQATIIHPNFVFPDDRQLFRTLEMTRQVLGQFAAASPRISVSELNWSLPEDQERVRQIAARVGKANLPTVCVLFTSGGKYRAVGFDNLIVRTGGPFAPPDAFLGESAFARAVAVLAGLPGPEPGSGARRMQFFNLPPRHLTVARYVFIFGLPAGFVALGVVVWLMRRK